MSVLYVCTPKRFQNQYFEMFVMMLLYNEGIKQVAIGDWHFCYSRNSSVERSDPQARSEEMLEKQDCDW